ncbi:serine carboxypeptidase-like protein 17 isoform X1 [Cinnamomum micranthum f. kanehirae]|uniref:Serine carboxypeptidase-like protein 17 isoform X1 n=1 Tax=Cinnamomum micranthum f. kanehirae TaxID=337451 RepID=A0A3S3N806_9MAGN|nr:serine carboxypeptidase-like protein 17 isoform X1 [Cinnamomum micranthum f. kanehirae]
MDKCIIITFNLVSFHLFEPSISYTHEQGTVGEWVRCNPDLHYVKEINSTIDYHLNLTTKGYRALIYSGDHDLLVPFVGTKTWIRSLNFSVVDEWRSWFVGGQIAGEQDTSINGDFEVQK